MFDFPYRQIMAELPTLAAAGFGAIQISPPQLSNGDAWWGRYQPLDYRVVDGPLGDETALRALVSAARQRNIRINADLVLNHMANLGRNFDLNYPPGWVRERYGVGGLFSPWDFHDPYCIVDWNDPGHVRYGRLCGGGDDPGLPDLRQDSPWALQVHRDFLRKLNDIGIEGYRVDAVKHMEPGYFNALFTPELVGNRHVYGEVIADRFTFDRDLEVYLRSTDMGFMDFPLHETLRSALKPGGDLRSLVNPVSFKGALAWDRSVAFSVNHDIPNNDGFRYMILDPADERLANVFILGRAEGVPHMFSDRGVAGGLREDRWKNAHRSPELAKMLTFHNAMLGQPQSVVFADECVFILRRGNQGLVTLNKCGENWVGWFDVGQQGRFQDTLSGASFEHRGWTEISIPARGARMLRKAE
jgi:alpha-amylase